MRAYFKPYAIVLIQPTLVSLESLQSVYRFDSTPIAPPDMKVVNLDPEARAFYATHGFNACYVGPALDQ